MALLLAAVAASLVGQLALNDAFPLMADWPPPEAAPAGSLHRIEGTPIASEFKCHGSRRAHRQDTTL